MAVLLIEWCRLDTALKARIVAVRGPVVRDFEVAQFIDQLDAGF